MHNLLALSILVIGGTFLGLTVLIVGNKAWRETVAYLRRRRRQVLEPLVLAFIHGDESSIQPVLDGRLRIGDRAVMESILLDHVQRVRGIEKERIGRSLHHLGYVDRYVGELQSSRWWKRAEAAERLGLAQAKHATHQLVDALQDEIAEVRMRAARALGALGGIASARPLIQALDEPNRWSTIRIADILTSMGRQVVEELMNLFGELTLPGKLAALDIVGRIRPLHAMGWIEERFEDGEADVRARACHAMGAIGNPESGPSLMQTLEDPEWPVRAMAAKALGRIRYREAIPALCSALRDREWWTRSNAAEALRLMGTDGIDALENMLDDDDTYARHQAVLMLEESGIVDQRAHALGRADGPEREAAAELLRRLIQAGQTGRLRELSARHPDEQVRQSLSDLLEPGSSSPEGRS